jgi:hypothetical protein
MPVAGTSPASRLSAILVKLRLTSLPPRDPRPLLAAYSAQPENGEAPPLISIFCALDFSAQTLFVGNGAVNYLDQLLYSLERH